MEIIFNQIRKEKKKAYREALDKWCDAKAKMSECVEGVMKAHDINDPICEELTLAVKEERRLWEDLERKEYAYKHEPRVIIMF